MQIWKLRFSNPALRIAVALAFIPSKTQRKLNKQLLTYLSYAFYYFLIFASLDLLVENWFRVSNDLVEFFTEDNYGRRFTNVKIGSFMFAIWIIINVPFSLFTITRKRKAARAYWWWLSIIPVYLTFAIIINIIRVSYYAGLGELISGDLKLNNFLHIFWDIKKNVAYFSRDFLALFISGFIVYLYRKTIEKISNANALYI